MEWTGLRYGRRPSHRFPWSAFPPTETESFFLVDCRLTLAARQERKRTVTPFTHRCVAAEGAGVWDQQPQDSRPVPGPPAQSPGAWSSVRVAARPASARESRALRQAGCLSGTVT